MKWFKTCFLSVLLLLFIAEPTLLADKKGSKGQHTITGKIVTGRKLKHGKKVRIFYIENKERKLELPKNTYKKFRSFINKTMEISFDIDPETKEISKVHMAQMIKEKKKTSL